MVTATATAPATTPLATKTPAKPRVVRGSNLPLFTHSITIADDNDGKLLVRMNKEKGLFDVQEIIQQFCPRMNNADTLKALNLFPVVGWLNSRKMTHMITFNRDGELSYGKANKDRHGYRLVSALMLLAFIGRLRALPGGAGMADQLSAYLMRWAHGNNGFLSSAARIFVDNVNLFQIDNSLTVWDVNHVRFLEERHANIERSIIVDVVTTEEQPFGAATTAVTQPTKTPKPRTPVSTALPTNEAPTTSGWKETTVDTATTMSTATAVETTQAPIAPINHTPVDVTLPGNPELPLEPPATTEARIKSEEEQRKVVDDLFVGLVMPIMRDHCQQQRAARDHYQQQKAAREFKTEMFRRQPVPPLPVQVSYIDEAVRRHMHYSREVTLAHGAPQSPALYEAVWEQAWAMVKKMTGRDILADRDAAIVAKAIPADTSDLEFLLTIDDKNQTYAQNLYAVICAMMPLNSDRRFK